MKTIKSDLLIMFAAAFLVFGLSTQVYGAGMLGCVEQIPPTTTPVPFPKPKNDKNMNTQNSQKTQTSQSNKSSQNKTQSKKNQSLLKPAKFPKSAKRCPSCLGQRCAKCNYTGYVLQ